MPETFTATRIGGRVGDEISLGDVPFGVWSKLRAQTTGSPSVRPHVRALVLTGREAVGGFGVKLDTTTPKGSLPGPVAELITFHMSEPPNLDRLVLLAALSHEAKAWIERVAGRRVRSVVATVLGDEEAQAHRMAMHVIERRVVRRRGAPNAQALVFGRQLGVWSLSEALESWKGVYR